MRAIGAVLSLPTRDTLTLFGAKSAPGPIITALVVSGHVGAGLGAELGSMKVTDQIDVIAACT